MRGDDIEADLRTFYHGLDLRDLWRPGGGDSQLTLRLLWVLIRRLPRTSALAISDNGGHMPWSIEDHLLADLWALQANRGRKKGTPWKDYPNRPKPAAKQAAQIDDARINRAEKRFADRRRRLEEGT
ncbi:hypothetical protein [Rhodococcus sp. IEGM 1318]|uniref:hypothetical protein n=1 Tax=Rhodococcus sp. IEGM 1318 TaxID=3082226 RepID=UPI0029558BE4|nr:hypothetical protein [Rhodococcus sp. IEGM 1318]MDV8005049.1 hypothetical protein [Rhodococcus sp. IEGM 1318]